MAYQQSNAVTTTKSTIFDRSVDNAGPLEWTFEASGADIRIYLTGVFPGPTTALTITDGSSRTIGSPTRGITKVEADVASGSGTLTATPSIA